MLSECPCVDCIHYVNWKRHPNPLAVDRHYCERKKEAIVQYRGSGPHYYGQWLIPCGMDMPKFVEREKEEKKNNDSDFVWCEID